jgi:hypothetical protein
LQRPPGKPLVDRHERDQEDAYNGTSEFDQTSVLPKGIAANRGKVLARNKHNRILKCYKEA